MTIASTIRNRSSQAIVLLYRSGLSIPDAFTPLWVNERGIAAKQTDSGDLDAPGAGGATAG
jgi:hypothetical protein